MEYEDWVYVPNFPEYVVSNLGRIHKTGRVGGRDFDLTPSEDGHIYVNLQIDGNWERRRFRLDRIVAFAFLKVPRNFPMYDVIHLDGDPTNCRATNLKWDV